MRYLKKKYPQGYTEKIREVVRRHIRLAEAYKMANLGYGPLDFSQHGKEDYD